MRLADKYTVRDWPNPSPKLTGSSQGSFPRDPTSVDTLVSSAWTQPAWGEGQPGSRQW